MVPEITAVDVVHGQVEVFPILKGVADVDEKGVAQSCQEAALVHHGINRFLCNDFGLVHFFHGEDLTGLLDFYFPYLAEAALADRTQQLEVGHSYSATPSRSAIHLQWLEIIGGQLFFSA